MTSKPQKPSFAPLLVGVLMILLGGIMYVLDIRANEKPINERYRFVQVAGDLEQPLFVTHAGDERLFIVERRGRIVILENGEVLPEPFLDIQDIVDSGDQERGLLSMAFHPNYAENGYFYVDYTGFDNGTTHVARYHVSPDDPNRADSTSEKTILTVEQPYANHNGGIITFGHDGYLYVGLGDGGSHNDPEARGQNTAVLLGKILRIDIDSGDPYAIPPDNPFVDNPDVLPEIWAYGLRNPWRLSFDRATGDLYIADVGQNEYEEIDYQAADSGGGQNYGWDAYEGNHLFEGDPDERDSDVFTFPIHDYSHMETVPLVEKFVTRTAHCSVTGGYVYRGQTLPELDGIYVYGDYCSGTIWTLTRDGDTWENALFMNTDFTISSFGEDADGELYVTDLGGGGVWRLTEK